MQKNKSHMFVVLWFSLMLVLPVSVIYVMNAIWILWIIFISTSTYVFRADPKIVELVSQHKKEYNTIMMNLIFPGIIAIAFSWIYLGSTTLTLSFSVVYIWFSFVYHTIFNQTPKGSPNE